MYKRQGHQHAVVELAKEQGVAPDGRDHGRAVAGEQVEPGGGVLLPGPDDDVGQRLPQAGAGATALEHGGGHPGGVAGALGAVGEVLDRVAGDAAVVAEQPPAVGERRGRGLLDRHAHGGRAHRRQQAGRAGHRGQAGQVGVGPDGHGAPVTHGLGAGGVVPAHAEPVGVHQARALAAGLIRLPEQPVPGLVDERGERAGGAQPGGVPAHVRPAPSERTGNR